MNTVLVIAAFVLATIGAFEFIYTSNNPIRLNYALRTLSVYKACLANVYGYRVAISNGYHNGAVLLLLGCCLKALYAVHRRWKHNLVSRVVVV